MNANSVPFIPISVSRNNYNSPQKEQLITLNLDQTSSINLALNQFVDLLRQTELNLQLINQQRSFCLPVKETPIVSGNPLEYTAFITAFDAIITTNVTAFFLKSSQVAKQTTL